MATRRPVVAGQFYPRNAQELRDSVQQYLSDADVEPAPEFVVSVVVPHAGYIFSACTAGYAYARVRGKKPKRLIVMGCSHRHPIRTASVWDKGAFDTPLGSFPIDEAFARELAEQWESKSAEPHLPEHSIEVQLPFLEVAVGLVPIVPVLFDSQATQWHAEAGAKLAAMVDETDLVVASTDLSHYLCEEDAHQIDKRTVDAILSRDTDDVIDGLRHDTYSMCAGSAVVAAMAFAGACGAEACSLWDYRTSAETSGDYNSVVGYTAITMERAA